MLLLVSASVLILMAEGEPHSNIRTAEDARRVLDYTGADERDYVAITDRT